MRNAPLQGNRSELRWFALYTRHRFEKKVASRLDDKGIESFLPMQTVIKQWSDRKKKIEEPLFNCYVFVRTTLHERLNAIETDGVVRMVSFNGVPSPIRDEEIEAVQRIVSGEVAYESAHDFDLPLGQHVEVTYGPLTGIRGQLVEHRGRRKLLVSIEQISQGICVEVSESDVRAVREPAPQQRVARTAA